MSLKIPPLVVFFVALGLLFGIHYLTPDVRYDYPYRVMVSRLFLVAGALIALAGIVAFRNKSTSVDPMKPTKASQLVTNGIYQYTRNPMYLGMAMVLMGGVVRIGNPWCLLAILFFVVYLTRFQIKPEEHALEQLFGEDYRTYCQGVRRWF